MSTFADVFPHDDPVARFMVSISMARNDVRHALRQAAEAGNQNAAEFTYWIRVATGHFFEADRAVKAWRQEISEVRDFIRRLPRDAKEELRKASSAIQKLGPGVLEHSRDRTFHYPYPTSRYQTDEELAGALQALGGEEVTVVGEGKGFHRLHFADDVALTLALRKHDPSALRTQAAIAADGAHGFVNFATRAWQAYRDTRGLEVEIPAPGDQAPRNV